MINEFKMKLMEKISPTSFNAWFAPKPAVMEGTKEKYKARDGARFYTNSFGVLVIEVHSRFFKDQIISRFGSAIHEVATSLGYKIAHVVMTGEEIPRAEPPLSAEQWSEAKYVLSKIGRFARSAGNHKASSAVFSHGTEDDIVEEPPTKPNPAYVYRGNQSVIFPVIINQQREEI
jgi:hypothetical protein